MKLRRQGGSWLANYWRWYSTIINDRCKLHSCWELHRVVLSSYPIQFLLQKRRSQSGILLLWCLSILLIFRVFRNSLPLVLWHIVGIIHQRIFEIFYWILYHLNTIRVLYFSIMIIELVCGLTHLQFCISWIIVDCISSEAAALVPRHQMIPMQVSISLNQF